MIRVNYSSTRLYIDSLMSELKSVKTDFFIFYFLSVIILKENEN